MAFYNILWTTIFSRKTIFPTMCAIIRSYSAGGGYDRNA